MDEEGNIVQKKKRISDLFNNEDWSQTTYLKYGRELHNQLKKYAQNLYRWIAEYRSFTHSIVIDAEVFENMIMKFNTPYAKKNKLSILKGAIEELQSLTYDDGRQIIKDLKFSTEKKGRRISKYIFSFKPFSIDLNYIKGIEGNNITFASQLNAPDNQMEHTRIIEKFLETFSGRKEYDNKNNRKKLIAFCKSMSDNVVEEALDRVAMNKKRGAGWLFRTLENWEKKGVKKLEDINRAENEIFSKPKKKNVPSWSNPNYVNTTSDEKKAELDHKKQEMLARLHNKQPK